MVIIVLEDFFQLQPKEILKFVCEEISLCERKIDLLSAHFVAGRRGEISLLIKDNCMFLKFVSKKQEQTEKGKTKLMF